LNSYKTPHLFATKPYISLWHEKSVSLLGCLFKNTVLKMLPLRPFFSLSQVYFYLLIQTIDPLSHSVTKKSSMLFFFCSKSQNLNLISISANFENSNQKLTKNPFGKIPILAWLHTAPYTSFQTMLTTTLVRILENPSQTQICADLDDTLFYLCYHWNLEP
jgi:hypothetical protein